MLGKGPSCNQGGGAGQRTRLRGFFQVAGAGTGLGRCAHSVHSFLMDRFHSQVRWSCLSSSVKKDLLW